MVSNYERIYAEITREAERLASKHDVASDALTELVMEIVDLEDRNRIKPLGNITQQVKNRIATVAIDQLKGTEV